MGLLTSADIKAIEDRSKNLAMAYRKYRLLFELAPLFKQANTVVQSSENQKKALLKSLAEYVASDKQKWKTLVRNLKTATGIKGKIVRATYNQLVSSTALEQDAKEYGLSFNKADYDQADNAAELFLLKSILPAMFTYPWKSQELRTIGAAAGLSAFLCAVVCCPEISTPEIKAIAALFVVPILMCAWAVAHHREGQQLTSQIANQSRMDVDNEIRGIVDNKQSSTAAPSIVKSEKTGHGGAKKEVPLSQRSTFQ